MSGRTVHPRVCGERGRDGTDDLRKAGSSPRVRGTPVHAWDQMRPIRFIPACTGNAVASWARCVSHPVHPRVCGERDKAPVRPNKQGGSSPRVRGTQAGRPRDQPEIRFIPACAGNAPRAATAFDAWAVHPRVCGERSSSASAAGLAGGSSPRVRGTRAVDGVLIVVLRFIPARGTRGSISGPTAMPRFIPACAGNASM